MGLIFIFNINSHSDQPCMQHLQNRFLSWLCTKQPRAPTFIPGLSVNLSNQTQLRFPGRFLGSQAKCEQREFVTSFRYCCYNNSVSCQAKLLRNWAIGILKVAQTGQWLARCWVLSVQVPDSVWLGEDCLTAPALYWTKGFYPFMCWRCRSSLQISLTGRHITENNSNVEQ